MSAFLRLLLETAGPVAGWTVVFVVAAFVVYVGLAVVVTLFHRDARPDAERLVQVVPVADLPRVAR